MSFIYLASPYSHPSREVMEWRFEEVARYTANYLRAGTIIFAPICHCHPTVKYGSPTDWHFWESYDHRMLKLATGLHVLTLPGWERSRGVAEEIRFMVEHGKPITYVEWLVDDANGPPPG